MRATGTFLLVMMAALAAHGQADVSGDGGTTAICAPERRAISDLELRLAEARNAADTERAQINRCTSELSQESQKLDVCGQTQRSCQDSRDALCSATDGVISAVLRGEPPPTGAQACIASDHQNALAIQQGGWAGSLQALETLREFETGESDRPPGRTGAPRTQAESAVAKLFGEERGALPLLYRRLLIEALRRIAPRWWTRLQGSGSPAVETFFAGRGPLDPELLNEARRGAEGVQGPPGPAGPALVTALKLVQAYLDLANCMQERSESGSCERARQLRQQLELSGPLVVERREQSIWATACSAISPRELLTWIEEFPSTHGLVDDTDWKTIQDAAFARLYTCFLADAGGGTSFPAWLERRAPGPELLTSRTLERLEGIRGQFAPDGREDRCAKAVRALQTLPPPSSCALPHEVREPLQIWLADQSHIQEATAPLPLGTCMALERALWAGGLPALPTSFERPPAVGELVSNVHEASSTTGSPVARLRNLCATRTGPLETFRADLAHLSPIAAAFGEEPRESPWHADPTTGDPLELRRAETQKKLGAWLSHLAARSSACEALQLDLARCSACQASAQAFDCTQLNAVDQRWTLWSRLVWIGFLFAIGGAALVTWAVRFWRGWSVSGRWTARVSDDLAGAQITVRSDWLRFLIPSRFRFLHIELPKEPAWERWGKRAGLVRAPGTVFDERDVNEAAAVARSLGAELALLVHDEGASPSMGAVRAMLEWAVKGAGKAVQILPIAADRLKWAHGPGDLLDLLEQTSLRGNPFEIRGRITSSSQFFNRERLVSGLLAGIQAGQWTVVTGLRRFGKSSLALEVGRQLNGASAYVDLAGFHHEIAFLEGEDNAADLILRYLLGRLIESARERFNREELAPPALPTGSLDSGALATWFAGFGDWCRKANGGRQASALIILDEIEQAIGVGPERVQRALDVLAIVLGRLRAALGDDGAGGGSKVGLIICGAIHPLLWAPLPLFGGQSIMGAFTRVCVPCLSEEAAHSMMRGLGARQGIRFTEPALDVIVHEAHGIPLLVRRIGSSLLELYDPERARQGSLGAVEVGQEGARAAVRREEEEGSPLRVWVESEIGDAHNPAGALLRHLAREGTESAETLRAMATSLSLAQFTTSGIDLLLPPGELQRRAEEAGSVTLQMLAETGLIAAEGALTSPERYRFPDGVVRRILARGRGASPFQL